MAKLVIVESPTKARTIRNFLPSDYRVEASMGHVRDLPQSASDIPENVKGEKWANLGVNVEEGFAPLYIIPKDKQKIVRDLKEALKGVDELYLATDEDREGESISWHLLQILKPKVPTKRMVFHEITAEAIRKSIEQCRVVDERMVHAQETRRILDRLVGYTLSPLLWKKVAWGLSAGRVQSVAVRVLVQRERERRAFRKGSYWDLKASLVHAETAFDAKLVALGGRKIATGADFDESTGQITAGRNVQLLSEADARSLQQRLASKPWRVANLEERPVTRKAAAPFTTSTLQQESNRKLRLSARDTMRTAQALYERGYITYMRTDSVHLSQQAIDAARNCVTQLYGANYLSPEPRQYTTKSKNAQEAHEAIRPSGETFRTPKETGLDGNEFRLYEMIWKRTVACQMADARLTYLNVQLDVEDAQFRSSGKRIDFDGFFRAYVEGSDDPDAAIDDQEVRLPAMVVGDRPGCKTLDAIGHETQPPARYSEASLVKSLESEGIGRPSTYASIIGTIVDRDYAQLANNILTPTFTAFAVTTLLEKHFPDLVDTKFTARMEQSLDDISMGEKEWLPYLEAFYSGDAGLANQVKIQGDHIDPAEARTVDLADLQAKVRIGRYGAYLETEREGESLKASIPKDLTPADLDDERVEVLLRQKAEGPDKLGLHPVSGEPIYAKIGNYGPYVQLGDKSDENPKPKAASLPKGVKLEEATLELAIGLLALPRLLGNHPETGGKIQAGLGRFGPYVVYDQGKDGKEFRSLKSTDDVLTVDLDRAVELLAEPKKGRGAGKSKAALRELGPHPKDQEAVSLFEGPYGIYIKHGKLNASLPEGQTVETLTMELAIEALDAKAATKGKGKGKSAAKSSSKPAAKKATAKKTTTQKAADKSVDPEDAIVKADAKAKATKAATKTTATKKPAAKSTAAKATATKATATKATAAKKPASKIMMKKTAEVPKAVGE